MTDVAQNLIEQLSARKPLPPLEPTKCWNTGVSKAIQQAASLKDVLRAALYLWNDELEQAHKIAQDIETPTGSLIHGIMHRRQPDYSNSKYWFRCAGEHAVISEMKKQVKGWDPARFVDQCEQASKRKEQALESLERTQMLELKLLAEYCSSRE